MADKKSNSTVENISSTKNPNKKNFSILESVKNRIKKTFLKPNKKIITEEASLAIAKKKMPKPEPKSPAKVAPKNSIPKSDAKNPTMKSAAKSDAKKPKLSQLKQKKFPQKKLSKNL